MVWNVIKCLVWSVGVSDMLYWFNCLIIFLLIWKWGVGFEIIYWYVIKLKFKDVIFLLWY